MAVGTDVEGSVLDHPDLTTEGRTLLTELVSIPSVSGEETDAAEALAAFFERHGRVV